MNCINCQKTFPDLLLDPAASANAGARAHLETCPTCAEEFSSLEATFSLLDAWEAPDVSPYFDQKLAVRLREEQSAPAPGWFEQLKTRLLLNTGRQFRPALAGVMALLLLAGGGGVGVTAFMHPHATHVTAVSATVNDLQILDKNEQAIQQMDQLLQENAAADDRGPIPQS
jgi:anti-sigma factor RsiW